jgi:hypothetical protein
MQIQKDDPFAGQCCVHQHFTMSTESTPEFSLDTRRWRMWMGVTIAGCRASE